MQRNTTPYYTYYITLPPPCKATFGTTVRQFWKKRRAGMGRFRYPAGAQTWIYAIPVGACRTSMNSNVHTSATSGFRFLKREEQAPPLQRKRNAFSNRTHTGRSKSFVGEALRLPQRTVWIHKTGRREFVSRTRGALPYGGAK